jgi:peptidoglycan/LPS O-acetylase OafA/YrhL
MGYGIVLIFKFVSVKTILWYFQYFMVGFLMADIYLNDLIKNKSLNWTWDILGGLLCVGAYACVRNKVWIPFVLPLIIAGIFLSGFRGVYFNRFLRNPFVTTIGGMCYTTYLYHYFIISAVGRITRAANFTNNPILYYLIHFAIFSAVIVIVCTILFYFLEKPFMKPSKWLRNKNTITA